MLENRRIEGRPRWRPRWRLSSFFLLACLASSACSPNSESEVIGIYQLVHSSEVETLRLLPDHSYVKLRASDGQNQNEETGTWEFETIGSGKYVTFRARGSDGHKTMPVERWFFSLYLGLDEKGAKLYKKIG
jgi:hypothetical protein